MNQTSRTDDTFHNPGWNQNPSPLNPDETTREDFNGIVNLRQLRGRDQLPGGPSEDRVFERETSGDRGDTSRVPAKETGNELVVTASSRDQIHHDPAGALTVQFSIPRLLRPFVKFVSFVGPGFMVAVAYIDPGNYATDIAAGANSKYALLFIILMSNLFAIFLQSLCIKLGSVTGLNLAENCRAHLPRWLNVILYILSESAIIATDIAEVIGAAIALNLLAGIPLVAGCVITLADVLFLLVFYRPHGSMWGLRMFEVFVGGLVLAVVILFCYQLSLLEFESAGEVFRGYLPSSAVVEGSGLYQSCGILGATVMPHSLFLGSGTVQPRLREYDVSRGYVDPPAEGDNEEHFQSYRPSVHAIRGCLKYSILELIMCLFTFALFVNSSILIVAAAALYGTPGAEDADLFGIHKLLSDSIAPAAGTIFALALLLSGLSAGIVCTISGQIVSEGMLNWRLRPWLRRLITRSISIIPSVAIAAAVGRRGLNIALTASQVVLSVILPFVVGPLVYFTSRNKFMSVKVAGGRASLVGSDDAPMETVKMRNSWPVTALAALIWLAITVMNIALLVLVGLGKA